MINVFCGSSSGSDPLHGEVADELGAAIAQAGHGLVYGGGRVGLMGRVADAVLANGGPVTGVITEQLWSLEVGHDGLTDLVVVDGMHARKWAMAERSDGVIVLPGGFGTLDETFEILTWNQLGIHPSIERDDAVPVAFLDVEVDGQGYFDHLFAFVDRIVDSGFMKPEHASMLQRAADPTDAVRLAAGAAPSLTPKWVGEPPLRP